MSMTRLESKNPLQKLYFAFLRNNHSFLAAVPNERVVDMKMSVVTGARLVGF